MLTSSANVAAANNRQESAEGTIAQAMAAAVRQFEDKNYIYPSLGDPISPDQRGQILQLTQQNLGKISVGDTTGADATAAFKAMDETGKLSMLGTVLNKGKKVGIDAGDAPGLDAA